MEARKVAPVIEAMWREGMLYHEIAKVLEVSSEAVHRLIYERMSPPERSAETAARLKDGRSSNERHLDGMRRAASVLKDAAAIDADNRGHAEAMIASWFAAHGELTESGTATSFAEHLGPTDLQGELVRFRAELRAGGLRESTIHAYLLGSSLFMRWLAGDYVPSPRRAERTPPPGAEMRS